MDWREESDRRRVIRIRRRAGGRVVGSRGARRVGRGGRRERRGGG